MFQAELLSGGDSDNLYHTEINKKDIENFFVKLKRFPTKVRNMNFRKVFGTKS